MGNHFTKGSSTSSFAKKPSNKMEKSQVSKVPCFDEISGNLDPIRVESISPLSRIHMDVSENSATSKWMVYNGKPN